MIRQHLLNHEELPEHYENPPQLEEGLELYYQAFFDLNTSRMPSFSGVAPLPWMVVRQYGSYLGFSEEQLEDLHYYIAVMDKFFIDNAPKKE